MYKNEFSRLKYRQDRLKDEAKDGIGFLAPLSFLSRPADILSRAVNLNSFL